MPTPTALLALTLAVTGGSPVPAVSPPVQTLRADHPDLSQDQARAMRPAALADALLAPGHWPVAEVHYLPEGMAQPPLPPGSPVRVWVRLIGPGVLDARSGFCVKRDVVVRTVQPGSGERDLLAPTTRYRLPDRSGDRCGGNLYNFFTVAEPNRPRAFAIVRLVAKAARDAKHGRPAFPVSVDDQLDRTMARFQAEHPEPGPRVDYTEIKDGRTALAMLPTTAISGVGHNTRLVDSDLLAKALRVDAHDHPRERWALFCGDWTIDVAFDGDHIAAMALRRAIPPPF